MTFEERKNILLNLVDFCQQNEGNRLNKYLASSLVNAITPLVKIEMTLDENRQFQFKDLMIKEKPKEEK